MSEVHFQDSGYDDLSKLLEEYGEKVNKVVDVLEIGAREYTSDARKLPSPRSRMSGVGYTHMIDTITYQKKTSEVEVGWGKYYGRMVEKGTIHMRAQPHLKPLFEQNKEKYYKKMIEHLGG